MNATGKGYSLLELAYRYHINAPDAQPAFSLKPIGVLVDDDHMSLETTVSYKPPIGEGLVQQSNMVIMEVSLPSGFVLNTDHLDSLKETLPIIKRTETKNDNTVAIIYFEYLTMKTVGLEIVAFRKHIVIEQRPTPIIIYDYYDNGKGKLEIKSRKKLISYNFPQRSVHVSSTPSSEALCNRIRRSNVCNQEIPQKWSKNYNILMLYLNSIQYI